MPAFEVDLVDSRLDKTSRDRLAVPVTISVIRDCRYVGGYVVHEFVEFILQGGCARRFSSYIPGQVLERA
jgi:hypothetical protein